jgi:hypothetical protein
MHVSRLLSAALGYLRDCLLGPGTSGQPD